jgi:hypothetical protein
MKKNENRRREFTGGFLSASRLVPNEKHREAKKETWGIGEGTTKDRPDCRARIDAWSSKRFF